MIKGLLLAYDPLLLLSSRFYLCVAGLSLADSYFIIETVFRHLAFVGDGVGLPRDRTAFHAAYILDRSYFPRPPGRSPPYTNSFANCSID